MQREVLAEVQELTNFIQNDQAFVCCRSCLLPICKSSDVGGCEHEMYRTFKPLPKAIK